MPGPYETEGDASADVRDIYAAYHKRGVMAAKTLDRLTTVCAEHGVKLGEFDRDVLRWLARQKPERAQVIVGLVERATAGNGGAVTGPV
ncbi:hypothetical protein GCM10023195_32630 [Actinoallomurus liliacearum]|uniref:Uncharacterized protein n=1 Tax=Actinoallomurus liliacearum TaxID=1080073 RepID=A0ABP8TJZ5_9ACTN